MPKILVDCTNVFWNPGVNSGIQRVVRNIVANLPTTVPDHECIPIVMGRNNLFRVLRLLPSNDEEGFLWRLYSKLARLSDFVRSFTDDEQGKCSFFVRLTSGLARFWISAALRFFGLRGVGPLAERAEPLDASPGDYLVLLDSTWNSSYFPMIEQLADNGVHVIPVVHDIFPISHPEYVQHRVQQMFEAWFKLVMPRAKGVMCVSKSTLTACRAQIQQSFGSEATDRIFYGYFYNGSSLDLVSGNLSVKNNVSEIFQQKAAVFLAVGTIEPRKNYEYLLDAFDCVWENGGASCLIIIGKIGWKCEPLIQRIRRHPLYNQKLFMINNANDNDLQFAYEHSDVLLSSSHAEGFGLPIVEALQRGLPVMASDIPVFREIGRDFVPYFDLANPQSLVDLVQAYERTRAIPGVRSPQEWKWIDWKDSAKQLVDGVISGAD